MTWQGWLQIAVFAAIITAVVKPLGGYIARNVDGSGRVQRALAPIENGLYHLAGVDPAEEQNWVVYALALLWFNLAGIVALYALQRLQNLLPLGPNVGAGGNYYHNSLKALRRMNRLMTRLALARPRRIAK